MPPLTDQLIPMFAAVAGGAAAVYTDSRRGVIPNVLTLPLLAAGLVLHTMLRGWDGLWFAGGGMLLGFGVLLGPFLIWHLGAGDVKLMAALGALLGPALVLQVFLYSSLFGAAIALLIILFRYGLTASLVRVSGGVRSVFTGSEERLGSFPYAASIWAGVLVALLLR